MDEAVVEQWVEAWSRSEGRVQAEWLMHQARQRGQSLEATRALLRVSMAGTPYDPGTAVSTPCSASERPPSPGTPDVVAGATPTSVSFDELTDVDVIGPADFGGPEDVFT